MSVRRKEANVAGGLCGAVETHMGVRGRLRGGCSGRSAGRPAAAPGTLDRLKDERMRIEALLERIAVALENLAGSRDAHAHVAAGHAPQPANAESEGRMDISMPNSSRAL